jgi:hypothetical protein
MNAWKWSRGIAPFVDVCPAQRDRWISSQRAHSVTARVNRKLGTQTRGRCRRALCCGAARRVGLAGPAIAKRQRLYERRRHEATAFASPLPAFVRDELEGFIDCGVLARGALRQLVLILPFELRARSAHDGELLGAVSRTFRICSTRRSESAPIRSLPHFQQHVSRLVRPVPVRRQGADDHGRDAGVVEDVVLNHHVRMGVARSLPSRFIRREPEEVTAVDLR